jgi:branched-chain amino acid transport system permease protein
VETVLGGYVEAHVRVLGQPLHGFKEVTAYLVILLALMLRPYGLFGTEHIERL